MFKEFLIAVYLLLTKIIFVVCKLFPVQKKSVMVSSFGDNTDYVAQKVLRQNKGDIVILKSKKSNYSFEHLGLDDKNFITFDHLNVINYIRSMYHLATAKIVFVDNYFAFLSVMNFKPNVECVQLWHAAGAVKKFGTEDPTFYNRSAAAQKRFSNVYRRFDKVIVGSDEMIPIFKTAFNLKDEQFLKTGIPRTDFFFDEDAMNVAKQDVLSAFPAIKDKKVILYAPTFRRNQLNGQAIALDIDKITATLGPQYMLLIRMHPAVRIDNGDSYPEGVIDVSGYPNIHHLLIVTDYLISDYSSLPYEFALLNRPQIFYAYDLDEYEKESGFWHAYEDVVPGPVVHSTDEIIDLIRKDDFDLKRIQDFSNRWNKYSFGKSSHNLTKNLYPKTPS